MEHGHGNTRLSDQHFTDCYNSLITMDWTGCASASTQANMTQSNFVHVGLYDMSYMWYGPVSVIICLVLGCLVSLIKPQDHRLVDRRLISPNSKTFFCWTPRFIKKKIENYYLNVGSEVRQDMLGKSCSVNTAYIPSDHEHSTQM